MVYNKINRQQIDEKKYGGVPCRINHVADVANATGLRGASGSRQIFLSA